MSASSGPAAEDGSGRPSSPSAGSEADEPLAPLPAGTTTWLVCDRCGFPLVRDSELLPERVESFSAAVYCYELEVAGQQLVCYSATNPSDVRFDVARAAPSCTTGAPPRILCRGSPEAQHSWFTAYAWQMAHCAACDKHVGWAFSPAPGDAGPAPSPGGAGAGGAGTAPPPGAGGGDGDGGDDGGGASPPAAAAVSFVGFVVTKTRPRELKPEEEEAQLRDLSGLLQDAEKHQGETEELLRLLNALPMSAAAPFFPFLSQLRGDPRLRGLLGPFVVRARELARKVAEAAEQKKAEADGGGAAAEGAADGGGATGQQQQHAEGEG